VHCYGNFDFCAYTACEQSRIDGMQLHRLEICDVLVRKIGGNSLKLNKRIFDKIKHQVGTYENSQSLHKRLAFEAGLFNFDVCNSQTSLFKNSCKFQNVNKNALNKIY